MGFEPYVKVQDHVSSLTFIEFGRSENNNELISFVLTCKKLKELKLRMYISKLSGMTKDDIIQHYQLDRLHKPLGLKRFKFLEYECWEYDGISDRRLQEIQDWLSEELIKPRPQESERAESGETALDGMKVLTLHDRVEEDAEGVDGHASGNEENGLFGGD